MSLVFGDRFRFIFPVLALGGFAAYVGTKLCCAHFGLVTVRDDRYVREYSVPARRGTVYDATGRSFPLVKSVPIWKYRLDPVALRECPVRKHKKDPPRPPRAIVNTIAKTLGMDYGEVLSMAKNTANRYQYLGQSDEERVHDILTDRTLVAGVIAERGQVRRYLCGNRFSHVLGWVNVDYVGQGGVELRYNRELSGVPGKVKVFLDARGREIYEKRMVSVDPIPGSDVYLTLDHNVQYEAEGALAEGVRECGADAGWCIVMDAHTGAIRAMASLPDFHPVDFRRTTDEQKRNRAVTFFFEPGSVMKVITACAGIDTGRVTLETMYPTNRDDDRYYRLPRDGSHKWNAYMSVRDAIVHSSNIVIGKLGCDIGPKTLWTYMKAFGFGERTGVELPGEMKGLLENWKDWDRVKWSRAPIGQGVSVTAIQICSAYQAIANDGIRMRPHLVSKVVGRDGNVISETKPEELGRPIAKATARQAISAMVGVASQEGTARRASVAGYSVAGKTGTGQKIVGGKYSEDLYTATFCGIVPASKPEFVILVSLDFGRRTKHHQGGNSAGPVFKRVAASTMRYYSIPPDRPDELAEEDDE